MAGEKWINDISVETFKHDLCPAETCSMTELLIFDVQDGKTFSLSAVV